MDTRVESDWVLERREGLLKGCCERDLVKVALTWKQTNRVNHCFWDTHRQHVHSPMSIIWSVDFYEHFEWDKLRFTRRLTDRRRLTRLPRSPEELSSNSDFGRVYSSWCGWEWLFGRELWFGRKWTNCVDGLITSGTAARLLVESRRLKLKPLFILNWHFFILNWNLSS